MRRAASTTSPIDIAVVGGDGVRALAAVVGVNVRRFPSSGDAGRGALRSALAAIRAGAFALVVVHARWMGHGDSESLRRLCRNLGVPCRVVTGGMTTVWRVLQAFVTESASDVR